MFDPPVSEQNIDPVPRSTNCKDHHEDHHTHDHVHDPGVSSVSIVCEGNLDLEKDFGALKMPTLIFLHQVYMATQAFQLAQGNTSFKEKPEIMLSKCYTEAISLNMINETVGLSFRSLCFSAFYGNEKKGENVGLNCNFQILYAVSS
ncbi:hypothetical protein DVH24_037434 [Malus domestica]|uniref:Uncharacterized protein n=1 Tax=Malus domestica TaxID=3750 RepID=A0A498HG16_MALDO|nr:hypothetical protein DVH24_037434 [Malus domestica]